MKILNFLFGIIGIIISIIIFIYYKEISQFLFIFSEQYISPDNNVRKESTWFLEVITLALGGLILIASILLFFNFYSKLIKKLSNIFDTKKIVKIFIEDDLYPNKKVSKITLVIATVSGILLHLYYLTLGEPTHEGLMEEFSSLFILASGVLLLASIAFLRKNYFSDFWFIAIRSTLVFLGLILLIGFGEEINWGQRALEIEPSEFFKTYNFQEEISIHNFFNPLFKFVYPAVGMGSFILLIFIWSFFKGEKNYYYKLFVPHKNLFFLIFWMACASYNGDSEIYEEMVTVFLVLYSLRIFLILKNLKKKEVLKPFPSETAFEYKNEFN
jgi:hypothetical protein